MHKNPLISVLTCNYNHAEYLRDNFEGLLTQTYKNWEHIIVDDGSTDKSRDIIAHYAEKDSRIKPIYLDNNLGVMKAAELGMERVYGHLFFGIGADDYIVNANLFDKAVNEFKGNKDLGSVFFKTRIIDAENNNHMCDLGYSPKKYITPREAARFFFHRIFLVPGTSALIPVKLLRMIGIHESLGPQSDHFLMHAASAVGGSVFIQEVGTVMRYSPLTYGAKTDFIEQIERFARLELYFRNLLILIDDKLDESIYKNWRDSIINDEKGRIADFDKLASHVDHFFSNLTIEHFTLFKQIIIDYKPKMEEFSKTVSQQVSEKRKIAHDIFDSIAGKLEL